jgi:hypothetical protein
MTEAPDKIWVHYERETDDAVWSEYPYNDGVEDFTHYGEYTRSDIAEELQAEVERLKAAHGKLWIALADIIECPGAHPNATVRRMAAYAEKALVHDTIAGVHPVPRFYKIEVKI